MFVIYSVSCILFYLLFVTSHYLFLEYVGWQKEKQLSSLSDQVSRDYMDKVFFKSYKSKDIKSFNEMDSTTRALVKILKKDNKKYKVVAYYKYFEKMYEVIYDENDIELFFVVAYDG
jgi:hypothetical protein